MAVSGAFIKLVLALALIPTLTTSEVFKVGDGKRWDTGVDYDAWAKGKVFKVGDTLLFDYDAGSHNVFKVGANGFADCKTTLGSPLTSGYDMIKLTTPGQKWYICGVSSHCDEGQKLFITVWPASAAPAPAPWSAPALAPAQHGKMA